MNTFRNKKFALITMLMMVLALVLPIFNVEATGNVANGIIITEVYYDTYISFEPDEYIAITNPTSKNVNISGWGIGDLNHKVYFPANTIIPAGETFYVVREAATFMDQMVVDVVPHFEYGANTVASIPQMVGTTAPRFANNGDSVFIVDQTGKIVDAVIYGTSTYQGEGWTGAPVQGVREGVILVRRQHEVTGAWFDNDSAIDFDTNRVFKAGQSRFNMEEFDFNGSVTTYTSPDSSYDVLTDLMNSAQYSLDLSIYEFHNPHLLDTLLDAINRGVEVRAYFDGGPVGGFQEEARYVSQQIVQAGGQVRYIVLDRSEDRHKRYRWNHSKYGIVDGTKLFVQSENWKASGVPTNNSTGNRGWGILIENADVAGYFQRVFDTDWREAYPDSFPYTPGHHQYGEPSSNFVMDRTIPTGNYRAPFSSKRIDGNFKVWPVLAPDTAFNVTNSIIGMIRGAKDVLYVEQMYAHKHWGPQDGSPETTPNIYLEEVINAARRGVSVKISLGDSWIDPTNSRDNIYTVEYVNSIAAAEGLDMEAKLTNSNQLGLRALHNKGVIADDKVLVSSINWSQNSPMNNREAGVIVQNLEVSNFYKEVFLYDFYDGFVEEETVLYEDFEMGSKTAYAAGNVQLRTGSWHFNDALLGSLDGDKKNGNRSARIRSVGSITMNFDVDSAKTVIVSHANFSSDTGGVWQLQKSTDGGGTWVNIGGQNTSTSMLQEHTFSVYETKPVRFRIVVTGPSGRRINIDDFTIIK